MHLQPGDLGPPRAVRLSQPDRAAVPALHPDGLAP
jgi:hypothetical protein